MGDDSAISTGEPAEARSTWLPPLAWSLFILAAFIAFELTAQPAVSAVILCCKFGWNDLLTGEWLRRRDPWPARGRACSWFCFAWALAKVALAAFLCAMSIIILVSVVERNGPARLDAPHSFIGAMLVLVIAMPIEAFVAAVGCVVARRERIRVWIDRSLHRARKLDQWPPEFPASFTLEGLHNGAAWARVALMAVSIVFNLSFAFFIAFGLHPAIGMVTFCLGVVATIALAAGAVARHPDECWGVVPEPESETAFPIDEV